MPYGYGMTNPYQPMPQMQHGNVIKVKGPDGADGFMGQPDCDYVLMDEDADTFYFVHFDQLGRRQSKVTCDFTVRPEEDEGAAIRQELDDLKAQVSKLAEVVDGKLAVPEASGPRPKPRARKQPPE